MNKLIFSFLNFIFFSTAILGQKHIVIIDSDTGNEIDDEYTLVRALVEKSFDVRAVNSAQYHLQTNAPENTVEISQKLNEEILQLMGLEHIPHPTGANKPLPDLKTPQVSPASQFIVETAHSLNKGQKLNIFITGPLTNVASAVLTNPEIIPKISVNFVGSKYDTLTNKFSYDFNCNNDTNAFNLLFNIHGLEMNIMTNTTARNLIFDKIKTEQMLKGKKGVWDALVDRWDYHISVMTWDPPVPADKQWIMWDVALVEAFLHPEMVKIETVYPLADNPQRKITVCTKLDAEAMKNDYWQNIQTYMNEAK